MMMVVVVVVEVKRPRGNQLSHGQNKTATQRPANYDEEEEVKSLQSPQKGSRMTD